MTNQYCPALAKSQQAAVLLIVDNSDMSLSSKFADDPIIFLHCYADRGACGNDDQRVCCVCFENNPYAGHDVH